MLPCISAKCLVRTCFMSNYTHAFIIDNIAILAKKKLFECLKTEIALANAEKNLSEKKYITAFYIFAKAF